MMINEFLDDGEQLEFDFFENGPEAKSTKKQEKINTLNQKFGIGYEVGIPILTTGGINLHEKFFFNSTEKKPTAKKNLRKKTTAKKTTVKKPTQKKPPKNSP